MCCSNGDLQNIPDCVLTEAALSFFWDEDKLIRQSTNFCNAPFTN